MDRRKFINTTALASGAIITSPTVFGSVASKNGIEISPNWNGKTSTFNHSWEGLGNIDQMRWILRGDTQKQLEIFRDELKLKHVRAVGIFDDDHFVYDSDPTNLRKKITGDGKRINWRTPFYIYDTLVEKGLSPIVTPCFIPGKLATGPETVFATKNNVTVPDWKEWEVFVSDFIKNLVNRYGIDVLKTWYFEVWNEPNLDGFWKGGQEGYWELYKILYSTIKSIAPELKIGGPSTARAEWISEFLEFGAKNNMQPDYIIGHCYNNDSASNPLSPFEGPQGDKENKSPNFTKGVVKGVRKVLNDYNFKGEFHMNEWGSTWHPYSESRESANEAAFIVKTMAEVSQDADYFAYWCLSDIYNQVGYGKEAFHGNYGMMSFDGLRKPNYFAHQLLSRMGTERVETNGSSLDGLTNVIATKSKKSVQLAVYGFVNEWVPGDGINRQKVTVSLPENINPNSIKLFKIDSGHNNIIADWKTMGSPDYLKPKQKEDLLAVNDFSKSAEKAKAEKNKNEMLVEFEMEFPSVVLIEAEF